MAFPITSYDLVQSLNNNIRKLSLSHAKKRALIDLIEQAMQKESEESRDEAKRIALSGLHRIKCAVCNQELYALIDENQLRWFNVEVGVLCRGVNDHHDIQFKLAGLCRHGHGKVVADNLKADHVERLGHDRVDLSRHNGRAGLNRRKVDLRQAGFRPRAHQPQVVRNFCQLHGKEF